MHIDDLRRFREQVAIPRMMQLFENTPIPDGACYIDHLEVRFLDGRSCGHDTLIEASGLTYRDGKVEEYRFSELDVSFGEFLSAHQDCLFVPDGNFTVSDELEELELRGRLRSRQECERLFPLMKCSEEMHFEFDSLGFEKMKYLLNLQEKQIEMQKMTSLGEAKEEVTEKNAERRASSHRSDPFEFNR